MTNTHKKPAKNDQIKPTRSQYLTPDYWELLTRLKAHINQARVRVQLNVNRDLVLLYWEIGRELLEKRKQASWGDKVILKLSKDLRLAFPGMAGLSPTNLKYMYRLVASWPNPQIGQQLVAQIPWGHNLSLIDKIKNPDERAWYIQKTLKNGWSRAVLVHQIQSGLYHRKGKAVSNFESTLPPGQSDLLKEIIKDPYHLEFLDISEEIRERELHRKLLQHMQAFLIELGTGFAFVGSNFHLVVGGQDFFLDLLFYHLKLSCFIVVELKTTTFKPEHAGKLNFYLSAVDDQVRRKQDSPSIGILLCQDKNKTIAEYALRDMNKPMGISGIRFTTSLPRELKGKLPSSSDLAAELEQE